MHQQKHLMVFLVPIQIQILIFIITVKYMLTIVMELDTKGTNKTVFKKDLMKYGLEVLKILKQL